MQSDIFPQDEEEWAKAVKDVIDGNTPPQEVVADRPAGFMINVESTKLLSDYKIEQKDIIDDEESNNLNDNIRLQLLEA